MTPTIRDRLSRLAASAAQPNRARPWTIARPRRSAGLVAFNRVGSRRTDHERLLYQLDESASPNVTTTISRSSSASGAFWPTQPASSATSARHIPTFAHPEQFGTRDFVPQLWIADVV